jgi:hypothetical protein
MNQSRPVSYRFSTDGALANPASARRLAARLRTEHGLALHGVALCLGQLESTDLAPLSAERKAAVNAFWTAYLAETGQKPEIGFDGSGMLADPGHNCFVGKR